MDVLVRPDLGRAPDMTRERWVAVGVCSLVVGAAVGLLSLVLYRIVEGGGLLTLAPVLAMVLLAATPFVAALLSGRERPLAAGAGGLAFAIGATVVAAALDQGGTGALPLTMGIAVGGAIALNGPARTIWARVFGLVLLAVYSIASGRIVSAVFVYPLLGIADEIVESFAGRRPPSLSEERATTSRR